MTENFESWKQHVPPEITRDALWRVTAYQLATYLADLSWADVTGLVRDRRTVALADQLYRAACSIGANIAEGYSYGTGPNRARFYEYALGSARETRDWYFKARHVLEPETLRLRLSVLERVIQMLLTLIPSQRATRAMEETAPYETDGTQLP
ncbi:MAG: four helix bundle protein [Thermoflexales bacterium]|nr:four helix bundle protein [Thermoflexales bacterium]